MWLAAENLIFSLKTSCILVSMLLDRIVLFFCCLLLSTPGVMAQQRSISEEMANEGYDLRFADTARSIRLERAALEKAVNKADEAICHAYIALTYRRLLNLDSFSLHANVAYSLAEQGKSNRAKAYTSWTMGVLKTYIEDNESAITYLLKAYDLFSQSKDYDQCAKIGADISYLFFPASPVKVRKYANEALDYAMKAGDAESLLHARLAVGGYMRDEMPGNDTQRWKSVLDFLISTVVLAEKDSAKIVSKSNIGVAYINLADVIYAGPPPIDESEFLSNLNKANTIAKRYGLKNIYRNSIGLKGQYFMRKGDFHTAEKLFKEGIAYQATIPYKDNYLMSSFYNSLKELAIRQGDYKAYFGYDTFYTKYNQLRTEESTQKMLQYADARFESEKKLTRIRQLEDDYKLQQKNKFLGYGIAGILFIGLVFMYRSYYFRQRYYQNREDFLRQEQLNTALKMELMEKETMENLAKRLSLERRLLGSQMDPHFIFNALGNIQSMILQKETGPAVSYLGKFAKLTREVLEHSRMESISLEDEIITLRHYIELQQLRLNNSFTYRIECNEEVDRSTLIPPLLIQPFVENAVEHGLKPVMYKAEGVLIIHFKEDSEQQYLICTVTDNGIGLAASKQRKTVNDTHRSMSTIITGERLALMQQGHPDAGFEISDRTDGSGCIVKLRIPIN